MDALLSEEQEILRANARALLARECPSGRVRAWLDDPAPVPEPLWTHLAELGWTGLPFAAEEGGAGLGLLDLAVLLEETGRALLPGPLFASVALAGAVLTGAGSPAQRRRWLPDLASGRRRATLALLDAGERWEAAAVRLPARRTDSGFVLHGTKRFVPEAAAADWIAVAARDEADGRLVVLVVDARAPGLAIRPLASIDGTRRLADLAFDRVEVPAEAALAARGDAALDAALDRARVALCAEMLGVAARALEASVDYARVRRQFGRPIGSFQAVQHRCADMLVALEGARSATWYAAWALDAGAPDAALAAAIAKAWVSEACVHVAGDAIQVHGGLGFTWEQDLHLLYRRAVVSSRLLGDPGWCREQVARAVVDGADASA